MNKPRVLYGALVLTIVLLVYFNLWMFDRFYLLAVHAMKPIFADWRFVLGSADCHVQGIDVYSQNPCDPWGRVHNYSSLFFYLSQLGLGMKDVVWSAVVLCVTFLTTAIFALSPHNRRSALLSMAVLLSPAVALAVERANVDILVFCLTFFALFLARQRQTLWNVIALLIALLLAALKIYPVALALCFLGLTKERPKILAGLGFFVVAILIYWGVTAQELSRVIESIPRPNLNGYASVFGGALIFHWIQKVGAWPASVPDTFFTFQLLTLLLFAALLYPAYRVSKSISAQRSDEPSRLLFLAGVSMLGFCFVLNTNYDYRCIFFLFLLPYLSQRSERMATTACVLIVLVLWGYYPTFMLRPLSPMLEAIKPIIRMVVLFRILATWWLMFLLAAMAFRELCSASLFKKRQTDL